MIEGVAVSPLKQIEDARGKVMHMLRRDSPLFERFGEVYFSVVNPGAVKAWKLHRKMALNLAVPFGRVRLVLYDERAGSATFGCVDEYLIGDGNYCLVHVPPLVWSGFMGISDGIAILANCATELHDPAEAQQLSPDTPRIPYRWVQ
ncbi:dTDP-4-dehydrorhamnose 3,5-epimerase family protein [Candidatus Magnetominusculus xianensis]|uniref:dTDP-4-dehydrorhamnose 3,5-epimerase n=1 Tax=Candidatus Magnetominusculus xianensis TaxID=1748249 RepID=A0ABR5SED5_9BACT|nr:dTDP-4-dehydrorhamnose 3,5-epimerase family protein [Candidatus Magnetominusculus xianensis]KWT82460.1 dTDP-4-dehydrorhamnose 3,5-epimerase [Candidatus Magnetominusculus xianensis]MBF0403180.1 dTDP-4-dehydrorhamnose 3,5-epimerase family protein [Nitrospirota bacterium]